MDHLLFANMLCIYYLQFFLQQCKCSVTIFYYWRPNWGSAIKRPAKDSTANKWTVSRFRSSLDWLQCQWVQ